MLTLPNLLTILRALLIPPALICVLVDPPRLYLPGLIILWVTLLTDVLDGKLAFRLNQRSAFGALFDALTDKILIHALLVAFLVRGAFPAWLVLAMFIRDMFTDGLRNFVAGRGVVMKAFIWGKMKFGFQFAALNAAFLSDLISVPWLRPLGAVLLGVAFAISLPGTFVVIHACAQLASPPSSEASPLTQAPPHTTSPRCSPEG
ncbi:MAG: CDP-alcohol phosphatidyltransferase family protein [bacterium]|nr:CDP-alcohol phosphatidyltransferase family protein [bacterium]